MNALKPYHISQAAAKLFLQKGFNEVTIKDIAQEAGMSEAEVFTWFGNKQDIILFLYQSINANWQLYVEDINEKQLAQRFEKAIIAKIELMEPYTEVLSGIMGSLMQNSKIGVSAPKTSNIRAMGLQTMQKLIDGATDSKALKKKLPELPSLLYLMHWALLFLYVQSGNKEKTIQSARLMAKLLKQVNNFSFFLTLFPFLNDISGWADQLVKEAGQVNHAVDREILKIIFNHRKTTEADTQCLENRCDTCMQLHALKIHYFSSQKLPIHFILPAFPAKSPNKTKVLGNMPDLGEEIALSTLENLCKEIQGIYPPGAHITICSDGRIFSELVGVTDQDVTHYVKGVKALIGKLGLQHVDIVNLEDLMQGNSFEEMRKQVIAKYAEPLDELRDRLKTSPDFKSLFNGIHRFISEDRKTQFPELSGNRIKEESKPIALQVIQHSNAWTRFLASVFPHAVRLSIHPYPAHSDKIGIQLTKATNNWLTPWHGVIVLQNNEYVLMKRSEAEEKAAKCIMHEQQPYYYTLMEE